MAKKKETGVKEKVMSALAGEDQCWFVKVQQVSQRGIPDIIVCWRGFFIAIELKTTDKNSAPDPLQLIELAEVNAAGGVAVIIDDGNWRTVLGELRKMVGADDKKGKRKRKRRKQT